MDGSITDDIPIDVAVQQGASTVVCMVTTVPEHLAKRPTGIMEIHSRTYQIFIDMKIKRDIQDYQAQARLVVVEVRAPFSVGLLDFTHIPELVDFGYRAALQALAPLPRTAAVSH